MSDMNINQVLMQMRNMSINAAIPSEAKEDTSDFANVLKKSIDTVNNHQKTSGKMSHAFEIGDQEVSLAEVMISSQKADVSFQAMVQVRNKLVDAYKEVMNLPL